MDFKKILAVIFGLVLIVGLGVTMYLVQNPQILKSKASSAAGVVDITITPATKSVAAGTEASFEVKLDTKGQEIDTMSFVLEYPSDANDLQLVRIDPASGWSSFVASQTKDSVKGKQIIAYGANTTSGLFKTVTGTPTTIATVVLKGTNATVKSLTFDPAQSKTLIAGADILFTPGSSATLTITGGATTGATVPDCTSLTTSADLNNLVVGQTYTFNLTAGGTAPIDAVELSVVPNESSCSTDLKPYEPHCTAANTNPKCSATEKITGAGTYALKWTPTEAGPFVAYGRVWNDSVAECRSACVDGVPRYLCTHATSCKLTGTVKAADSTATRKYKCSSGVCVRDDISGTTTSSTCDNACTSATAKYKCSSGSCVRDDVNGSYTSSNCYNSCTSASATAKYRCSSGSCVRDDLSGTYTSSTCNNACRTVTTTQTTTTTQPTLPQTGAVENTLMILGAGGALIVGALLLL